jgi:hypothetical protein
MDKHRRNLIKAGASAAVGSMLMGQNLAQAQSGATTPAVTPLAGKIGMRLEGDDV